MLTHPKARWGSLKYLRQLYRILNREYFESKLPTIPIEWADLPGTIIARVRWRRIGNTEYKPYVMQFRKELKPRFLQRQVGMSMVHEMAHMVLGPESDCLDWGGPFDRLMFKLTKKGAFQRFW
ncbi:MAG: hypothetical protein C5B59_06710 [Bacteroidetes bacterium]|nr:MAG: hypothetical protein C5B59_06710 [Bacteroidota bacterium]